MAGPGGDGDTGPQNNKAVTPARHYLSLTPLTKLELPYHPSYNNLESDHSITLSQFLDSLFDEILGIDLDVSSHECGQWTEKSVQMPPPPADGSDVNDTISVPIAVDQRTKTIHDAVWLARRSTHQEDHVKYSELDALLSHNHSHNEAVYTPSVFHGNELLVWDAENLQAAINSGKYSKDFGNVEMAIFQMFHEMPGFAGLQLQDRVFPVLVISARSTTPENSSTSPTRRKSWTVQLPIDFDSFSSDPCVERKSYMRRKPSDKYIRYDCPPETKRDLNGHGGNKLTVGKYVSLERLSQTQSGGHCWDMMTLSAAGGITRRVPNKLQQKPTLDAVAKDVKYVISYIAGQRRQQHMQRSGSASQATG